MTKIDYMNKKWKGHLTALCTSFGEFIDQYGCDCGMSGCKDCLNTKTAQSAMNYADKAIQGEE